MLYKKNEFIKIINYLEKNTKNKFKSYQIDKALNDCDFENLKKQEDEKGFKESSKDKKGNIKKFFHLGPKNNWEKILDQNIKESIEKEFQNELLELGYI